MASKTRMTQLVRALDVAAVLADLQARPDLLSLRDERGRTWLHLTAGLEVGGDAAKEAATVELASALLDLGLDIDDAAFVEGEECGPDEFRATPLWYAISRGRNLTLARYLLGRGCSPDYCLFAACWNNDVEAIRLVRAHGAPLSPRVFVEAVGWSRFAGAEELLRQGADVDAIGPDGRTALHMMLKKDSPIEAMRMLARHGARGDIPGPDGRTAVDILRRKKDPAYRALADELAVVAG